MVAQTKSHPLTPEEYLTRERDAETKSEYYDGRVVAMSGASPEHNLITANVIAAFKTELRGSGCLTFASDLRVRIDACNRYFYPDVSVVCPRPSYENIAGLSSLRNPTLIVEILSDSTERNDRCDKWLCYQTLGSLATYILVTQDQARIEVYTRMEGADWRFTLYAGLDAEVTLQSPRCTLNLSDLYADVTFPEPSSEEERDPG